MREKFQPGVDVMLCRSSRIKTRLKRCWPTAWLFEDSTAPAWNNYSNLYLNQRRLIFAEHSNSLTAYWRPVLPSLRQMKEEPHAVKDVILIGRRQKQISEQILRNFCRQRIFETLLAKDGEKPLQFLMKKTRIW